MAKDHSSKPNQEGIDEIFRVMREEFAKRDPIPIPLVAQSLISPSDRAVLRLAKALAEVDAFSPDTAVNVRELEHGLSDDDFETARSLALQDGFAVQVMVDVWYLNSDGRELVRQGAAATQNSGTTVNNDFSGATFDRSNIATGSEAVQNITNNLAVDVETLKTLLEGARQLPLDDLDPEERDDFADDLRVIEAQIAHPGERRPGLKRAVRGIQAVAQKTAVSVSSSGVIAAAEAMRSLLWSINCPPDRTTLFVSDWRRPSPSRSTTAESLTCIQRPRVLSHQRISRTRFGASRKGSTDFKRIGSGRQSLALDGLPPGQAYDLERDRSTVVARDSPTWTGASVLSPFKAVRTEARW